jgi:hypothetical protein
MSTKSRNVSDVYGKYNFFGGGGGSGEGIVPKMCNLSYILKRRTFYLAVITEKYCSRMSSRTFYQSQVAVAACVRKFENLRTRNSTFLYFRTPLGPTNLVVQNPGRYRSHSVGWPVNSTPFTEAYLQQPANGSYCTINESCENPVSVFEIGFNIIFTFASLSSERSVHIKLSD